MRAIVVFLIGLYQRYLSPHKGFRCAHAVLHHGLSCSAAVKQIVATRGIWRGAPLVRQRFIECRNASHVLHLESEEEKRRRRRRRESDGSSACWAADGLDGCDGLDCLDFSSLDCSGADCSGAHCSLFGVWR